MFEFSAKRWYFLRKPDGCQFVHHRAAARIHLSDYFEFFQHGATVCGVGLPDAARGLFWNEGEAGASFRIHVQKAPKPSNRMGRGLVNLPAS